MKNLISNLTMISVILLVSTIWSNSLFAENTFKKSEFTRKVNKEFDVSATGEVKVHNKYGNVNITTWDKNKVKFDIIIKIKTNDKSRADEAFERIKVTFNNTSDLVEATTTFESRKKRDWKFWKKFEL